MYLSKGQLTFISTFAEKTKTTRPTLASVRIEQNRIAATDGHFLAIVATPDRPLGNEHLSLDPMILEIDSVNAALKVWPKKYSELEVNCLKTKTTGRTHFIDESMPSIEKVEGTYPDLDQVIPKDPAAYRVYLTPEYLAKIGQAFHKTSKEVICLELPANGMGGAMTFSRGDEKVILMPCKGKDKVGPLAD